MWRGLIEAYRDRLPVTAPRRSITLHEGNTPLLPAPVLSARLGCDVYLKVEGANPTGSFKDRGMTSPSPRRSRPATRRSSAPPPATPAPPPPRTRPAPGSPARCWCRRARSRSASWPRRWCTAPSCSRSAATSTTAWRWPPSSPRTTRWRWSTRSTPTGCTGRRPPPSRSSRRSATPPTSTACRSATPATSPPTGWATREDLRRRQRHPPPEDVRLPGRRRRPDRHRPGGAGAVHHRHRDPDRQPGELDQGARRPGRLRRADRRGHRPGDPVRVPAARPRGRRLRRAGQRGERRRPAPAGRRRPGAGRLHGGLHGHRARPEGPGVGDLHRARRRSPSPTTRWPRRAPSTWPEPAPPGGRRRRVATADGRRADRRGCRASGRGTLSGVPAADVSSQE